MKFKIESMYHEFYKVQVSKIDRKMNQLKRQVGASLLISFASLIPAVATNGLSLLGLLVAGMKGYKDYDKYIEQVKGNPAFIFWKARRKK